MYQFVLLSLLAPLCLLDQWCLSDLLHQFFLWYLLDLLYLYFLYYPLGLLRL